MRTPPNHPREAERLDQLASFHILDTPPESEWDDLVTVAAQLAGVPIALVSLVDASRQWFKARVGLEASQTPRDVSFCGHAILGEGALVVPDAHADERFADNPLVTGPPFVRFYFGVPIGLRGGLPMGTLCVIDHVPRVLQPDVAAAMHALARQVGRMLVHRRDLRALEEARGRELAAREQLQDLLDNATDLIQSVGPDGRILYTNRSWRLTFGYEESEVRDLRMWDVIAPESRDHCRVLFERLVDGEDVGPIEAEFLARDGRRVWVEGNVNVRVVAGLPTVTRGIFRDVTARRAAQFERQATLEKLARSDARLRALVDAIPDATFRVDAGGLILEARASKEFPILHDPATLIGQSIEAKLPPEVAERYRSSIREVLADGEMRVFEYDLEVDGVARAREARLVRCGEHEAMCFVRDVTERRRLDRMKNEFVSTVSHELRTPLTSIRGSLGLLEGGAVGDMDEEARSLVRMARQNADRLVRLVNDILDLEKMEAGRLHLSLGEVDAAGVLGAAVAALGGVAQNAGVSVVVEPADGTFLADRDRVVQVLVNLLSNALKYTPPGRTVRLRGGPAGGGHIRFEVRDEGPGFPSERVGELFERFRQLDASDRRAKGGTGLGLAISRAIVEQHGGRIGAESEEGRGATFWFELPAGEAERAP
ncbi:MAG: ATP-binding protein [Myxococcota bacterium]